jgi:hypothetical protein
MNSTLKLRLKKIINDMDKKKKGGLIKDFFSSKGVNVSAEDLDKKIKQALKKEKKKAISKSQIDYDLDIDNELYGKALIGGKRKKARKARKGKALDDEDLEPEDIQEYLDYSLDPEENRRLQNEEKRRRRRQRKQREIEEEDEDDVVIERMRQRREREMPEIENLLRQGQDEATRALLMLNRRDYLKDLGQKKKRGRALIGGKKKGKNPWMEHVHMVWMNLKRKNPNASYKDALKIASKSY